MNIKSKKSSGFISLLLVFAIVLPLMTPVFAHAQEGSYREDSAFDLAETTSGAAISGVSTPGALGYDFDAENKEIIKYIGTETEIIIPDEFDIDGTIMTVESIGEKAFQNNKTIVKVIIGENVKEINDSVFMNCSSLKKITLNEALEKIGEKAFALTKIEEINIPGTVDYIGKMAFYNCKSLKKVTLNEGLEEICESAFSSTVIEEIVIPSTVEKIGMSAFKGCKSLSKAIFNEGLKEISDQAFDSTIIGEIVIPSTIETIGKQIFNKNGVISKITILNKIENIDISDYAFPEGVEIIYTGSEESGERKTPEELGYEFDAENKEIKKYTGIETEIVIPSELKVGEEIIPVESIGEEAFVNTNVVNITLSGSMKVIGRLAFAGCLNLNKIILNDGLEKIESNAFYESAIKEINIPSSVKTIGSYAFKQCRSLSKVTLNEGLEEMGEGAFANTVVIEEINIPGSVKSIGAEVFNGCTKLKTITLNEGLEEIGSKAFYQTAITGINIPGSVQTIGGSAFSNCTILREVTLNEGLQKISTSAFNKTAIKEINIPGSVQTIGENAFIGCTDLSNVTLNEGLKEILKQAFQQTAIEEIIIPSTIEKIEANIFRLNTKIKKITVLNKKEKINIDKNAFPANVEVIYKEKEEPGDGENIIADTVLKKIINKKLHKEDLSSPVTKNELAGIDIIESSESGLDGNELWKLKSLEGLQYATGLTVLELNGVQIVDFNPLKGLSGLESISVNGGYAGDNAQLKGEKSALKDITPIGEMKQLKILQISGTQLKDIISIGNLKNLQVLDLTDNEISDISCLKDVPIASGLSLRGNGIADFSPMKGKDAFEASTGEAAQRVTFAPVAAEFENPLISSIGGYMVLCENEYVVNTGDNNGTLKIIKMPAEGGVIKVEYGSTTDPCTLTLDLTKLNVIKDPVLRKALNLYRNEKYNETRSADQPVLRSDLTGLKEFTLEYIEEDERKEIKDIAGLENLINATKLDLKGTSVENLEPIRKLTKLESIFLGGSYSNDGSPNAYFKHNNTKWRSPLKDIGALSGLTNLKALWINDSEVADISPLKDLKNLNSVYLMRNKIEDIECLKDVPIATQLYLQGNCIGDFSSLKGKDALKLYNGQSVKVILQETEFKNPLRNVSGEYEMLTENEYAVNTGDISEKLKVLKIPADSSIISLSYGSDGSSNTLLLDISVIRDEFESPSDKRQVYFYVLRKQEGGSTVTVNNAFVQVWNQKGEELANENTVLYAWSLIDGEYTYKASHPDYKDAEGTFKVMGKGLTVEVSLVPISGGTGEEPNNPGGESGGPGGSSGNQPESNAVEKPAGTEIAAGSGGKISLNDSVIEVSDGTFDKNVTVSAEEKDLYLIIKGVDDKGNMAEIKNPLIVTISYDKEVRNADSITVILTDENGNEEIMGGIYDTNTKTVKFLTNKWGKFTVRESINEFRDLSGAEWAKAAIRSLSVKGIMKGKSEDMFAPSDYITRAEFTAIMSRMLKFNENIVQELPFKDVAEDVWYYNSIAAVYGNGLISGKSSESFDPEGNITRQEMAVIIGNMLGNNLNTSQAEGELNKFKDWDSIANWAESSVATATGNGVTVGIDGNFMPNKNTTRAEAAVMVYRLYPLIMNH